jgi:hypothetical protein
VAFVAIVVAFTAGWLMRRWRGAENTLKIQRARADIAGSEAWKARLWFAVVVILILALAYAWLHSH